MFGVLITALCFYVTVSHQSVTVEIPNGRIEGTLEVSYRGRPYMQFNGIPYAKSPTGNLRFEPPQPADPWNGTLAANKKVSCSQIVHVPEPPGGESAGSEDCLYLYVSIPGEHIDPTQNYDVLVHIHGGSFSYGSGSGIGGKYLMDRDMIYVSMNYRLGIFGFLSTQDAVLPGNLAFKDQVLALKWIRDNVQHFGGNSDSVTITGMSAGAISVHYHILSPMSKGLFHKAMAMSGSAMRAMQATPREKTMTLGKHFDCPLIPTSEMIECLKRVAESDLLDATRMFRPWIFNPFAPFSPVIDKWSDDPFLPQHPKEIFKSKQFNHVPFISSSVADEGLYPGAEFIYKETYLIELNARWNELAPFVLMFKGQIPDIESAEATKLIRAHYFANETINKDSFTKLINMFTDKFFNLALDKSLRLHAQSTEVPIYSYRFNYTGEKVPSISQLYSPTQQRLGVSHGDDCLFSFDFSEFNEESRTLRDEKMMDFFLDLYVHFMKTGTVHLDKWNPVSKDPTQPIHLLQIQGPEAHNMGMQNVNLGNAQFWDQITFEIY